jgi:hypothetical protein
VRGFLAELERRDALLARVAWLHVGLALVFLAAMPFDGRSVMGADPWLKPFKFAVSIAVYLFSLAWLVGYARPASPRVVALVSRGAALAMLVEIACISLQALRGVPSHFNHETPFDDAVFSLMGLMIAFNTALVALLFAVFLRGPASLPRAERVGICSGIALMLLASAVGGMMVGRDSHSVGGEDGGPGLPLVGWSREHGDLRPAHAVGLHALQVLPLVGALLARRPSGLAERKRVAAVVASALLYGVVFAALLRQALAGRPLVS